MWPRPVQLPHPPIWIGGNSTAAMRRAVERAEGWVPFPNPATVSMRVRTPPLSTLDELGHRLDAMHDYARRVGRDAQIDVCFAPFTSRLDPMREELEQMEAMGVTWTTVGARQARTRAEWIDEVRTLGEKVVAQYR